MSPEKGFAGCCVLSVIKTRVFCTRFLCRFASAPLLPKGKMSYPKLSTYAEQQKGTYLSMYLRSTAHKALKTLLRVKEMMRRIKITRHRSRTKSNYQQGRMEIRQTVPRLYKDIDFGKEEDDDDDDDEHGLPTYTLRDPLSEGRKRPSPAHPW
jgi:hypothetical protein